MKAVIRGVQINISSCKPLVCPACGNDLFVTGVRFFKLPAQKSPDREEHRLSSPSRICAACRREVTEKCLKAQ